jgi:hypothetical protein
MATARREFVTNVSAGLLGMTFMPTFRSVTGVARGASEPWLDGLAGRHKQFFDVSALAGGAPLERAAAFLDVYVETYGLSDRDLAWVSC